MIVIKLKENLMRLNAMRFDNNKNQGFHQLDLEKKNMLKDQNIFFTLATTSGAQLTI